MRPIIARSPTRLGLDIVNDRGSYEDCSLGFAVTTRHPEWLEAYDEVNTTRLVLNSI